MRRELLEERKQTVYGLICDEFYVPMKAKEMAILMNVPKAQRHELQEVLDALVAEGKIHRKENIRREQVRILPVSLRLMPVALDLSPSRVRRKMFLFRRAARMVRSRMM